MDILRITAQWNGFMGAPGYSVFHFTTDGGFWDGGLIGDEAQVAADSAASRVSRAFGDVFSYLPSGAVVRVLPEAQVLDSDTGEIQGFVDVEADTVNGSGDGGGYSAASGAVVNWVTNDYRFGRRIRGRTFLVPLDGSAYQSDGTLTGNALTALRDFGDRMIDNSGGPEFGVWSRPRGGTGGVFATVTARNVPDMAAVLRSRRD